MEYHFYFQAKSGGGASANQSDVDAMKRDLNKILGRDESGTAEVDGIPTLVIKPLC